MPDLAAPAWLLALALVPLVRWLHRFHAGGKTLRVPILFLWREAGAEPSAGARRRDPDPAWRRRAGIVALLVLTLVGPAWTLPETRHIAVWIDDSPALFAQESDGRDRLALAAEALAKQLGESGAAEADLHALHRPGAILRVAAGPAATLEQRLRAWLPEPGPGPLAPPPPAPTGERWLLSAGTDPRVKASLAGTRFRRVIPLGVATENQAVLRLAVRPSLRSAGELRGLAEVVNAGLAPATRVMELRCGGTAFATSNLTVAPGERAIQAFALPPGSEERLAAVLLPPGADALPLDDTLELGQTPTAAAAPIATEGPCPPAVRAVIAAHPGLRPAAPVQAELRVLCGGDGVPPGPPTLWLPAGSGAAPTAVEPVWAEELAGAMPPRLAVTWLHPIEAPAGTRGRTLLAAGRTPLVIEQDRPRRILLLFAVDAGGLAARPELPALIGLLLDRLAGRELLLPDVSAARNPAAANIAPGPLPRAEDSAQVAGARRLELAPWLMAAALLLLFLDMARGTRAAAIP